MILQNHEKLLRLKLDRFAAEYKKQSNDQLYMDMTFDERLALLLDSEIDERENRRIARIRKQSHIKYPSARINDIYFFPDREINKARTLMLGQCNYIRDAFNVVVYGATGSGKTYYVSALGNAACERGIKVRYIRLPELMLELDEAVINNTYRKKIRAYEKIPLLIIDEWMIYPLNEQQQSHILELLEVRDERASTIFASQYFPEGWHEKLGGGAVADAILDRIISRAYEITIKGEQSMRMRKKDILK